MSISLIAGRGVATRRGACLAAVVTLLAAEVSFVSLIPGVVDAVGVSRPEVAGGEPGPVEDLSAGAAAVAVPGAVPVAVPGTGFDGERSVEVVSGRSTFETLYVNSDGSNTLAISDQPVHYETSERVWERIDSTLVRGEDGSWSNAANSWHVSFPATLAGSIGFASEDGRFGWRAQGAADVPAVVVDGGSAIRYVDAWPGADLVYRVTNSGVEELVELKSNRASGVYRFELSDATIEQSGDGLLLARSGELSVALGAPEAFGADGRGVPAAARVDLTHSVESDGRTVLVLRVDDQWLKQQPAKAFPIVLDPTIYPTLNLATAYPRPGQGYPPVSGTRMGNPAIAGLPAMAWRSVARFDYYTGANNLLGLRISDATLAVTQTSGTGSGSQGFKVFWADVYGFHDTETPRTLPPPYPYGYSWSGQFGSGTLPGPNGYSAAVNLTALYDYWTRNSLADGTLLLKGDNEPTNGVYTLKHASLFLFLTYNSKPSVPAVTAASNPADGSRWWSLPGYLTTSQSSNGEGGEAMQYRVEFGADAAFSSGVLQTSNWQSPSFSTAPIGGLALTGLDPKPFDPGQTYYWRIAVTDGWYVVPSAARSFVWDPDPMVAPSHGVGPLSVNAATGTYSTAVSSPSFATVGGEITAALSYTNTEVVPYGLTRAVWKDVNFNGVVDSDEPVVERHRVGSVEAVWGAGGPTSDTSDYFIAEWTGYITAAGSGWQLGLDCDQKAKVWVNGALVLDKMSASSCSGVGVTNGIDWASGTVPTTAQTIRVQLAEITGNSKATLWVRQGSGAPSKVQTSW